MSSLFKNVAAYQLVRLISSPFKKWDAYKHGLIDDEGETIRKPKTDTEKKSFGMFQRLVRRIKQIMRKAPFGAFKIASLAIALKLLKENTGHDLTYELEQFGLKIPLSEDYNPNVSLSQGKYTDENGNFFIIKENIKPIDNIVGINIYEVQNIVTNERILVTEETSNKL